MRDTKCEIPLCGMQKGSYTGCEMRDKLKRIRLDSKIDDISQQTREGNGRV
jgi:hypothetical protein